MKEIGREEISTSFCSCSRITKRGIESIKESLKELALLETKNVCGIEQVE